MHNDVGSGILDRAFALPEYVEGKDETKLKCDLKDGVLTVAVPKIEGKRDEATRTTKIVKIN